MKRYFLKLALLVVSTAALISCEEDDVNFGGKNFVTFEKVASNRIIFFEHLGVSKVPVNMAFPVDHDVTIKFTVEPGTAVEGQDFNLITNRQVTIPAGALTANIEIQVIDNEVENDSKAIVIQLTESSDTNVTVGMANEGSKLKRMLIVNDDCTTNFFNFVGTFSVTSGTDALGIAEVDVNDNGDCNIIRISGVLDNQIQNTTDSYIEFTMVPGAGANGPNQGTITAIQQLYCAECYTYEEVEQTFLFTGGGQFSTNANVTRLVVSGTISAASGVSGLQNIPTSVTLTKI